eukprot:3940883-Rhodomonas_salina.2
MEVTKKLAAIEPYLLLLQLGEVWSNGLVTAAQLSEERGGGERAEREREERVGVTAGYGTTSTKEGYGGAEVPDESVLMMLPVLREGR